MMWWCSKTPGACVSSVSRSQQEDSHASLMILLARFSSSSLLLPSRFGVSPLRIHGQAVTQCSKQYKLDLMDLCKRLFSLYFSCWLNLLLPLVLFLFICVCIVCRVYCDVSLSPQSLANKFAKQLVKRPLSPALSYQSNLSRCCRCSIWCC